MLPIVEIAAVGFVLYIAYKLIRRLAEQSWWGFGVAMLILIVVTAALLMGIFSLPPGSWIVK